MYHPLNVYANIPVCTHTYTNTYTHKHVHKKSSQTNITTAHNNICLNEMIITISDNN